MKINFMIAMLSVLFFPVFSIQAAEPKEQTKNEPAEQVELFSAMEKGLVEVKLTPANALECTVSVTNKSDKPIVVDMPKAFAGVHVVAQFDGPGLFGGGGAGMEGGPGGRRGGRGGMGQGGMGGNSQGGNQSVGGGMGGMGGGMGGMGGGMGGMGGGGWFIPAEKTVKEKVRTVCLEHGKKDPRPALHYTMVPIDKYTSNKTTQVLCSMLSNGSVDQLAVQAAVWNQENELSFEELAAKKVSKPGRPRPLDRSFFTPQQIRMGQQVLDIANQKALEMQEDEEDSKAEQEILTTKDEPKPVDRTTEKLTEKLLSK